MDIFKAMDPKVRRFRSGIGSGTENHEGPLLTCWMGRQAGRAENMVMNWYLNIVILGKAMSNLSVPARR